MIEIQVIHQSSLTS